MSYRSDILAFLHGIGAREIAVTQSGRGHPQIVFVWHGRQWRQGISGTPGDCNAAMLKIFDLRRTLGLQPGARRVGERRVRHRHGVHGAPPRCPVLTALADWHEQLLPLWRAMCAGERRAA